MIQQQDSSIIFNDLIITGNPSSSDFLDSGRLQINNSLTFYNCKFNGNFSFKISSRKKIKIVDCKAERGRIAFRYSKIKVLEVHNFEGGVSVFDSNVDALALEANQITIWKSIIGQAQITGDRNSLISIKNSTFSTSSKYYRESFPGFGEITQSKAHEDSISQVLQSKVLFKDFKSLSISALDGGNIEISGCQFISKDKNGFASISGTFESIDIKESVFKNSLIFNSCRVNQSFSLRGNKFQAGLSIKDLDFPASRNFMNWNEFDGEKLWVPTEFVDTSSFSTHRTVYSDVPGMFKKNIYLQLYKASSTKEISNLYSYEDLIDSYQKLYNIFKQRGDLESCNYCYSEMKDVQTRRFKFLYHQNPTFNSFFRWRLSTLMKVYTNHGTDPAKAITISFWTIVFFGVFYFFFPSDWDVTSKTALVKKYKLFVEKNEHGYLKPFLSLILGFLISLVNAVTLSLNSFTTLGFGNIPTHGIARYVCIIQGFIGWFLLSIFTVALINQVLF